MKRLSMHDLNESITPLVQKGTLLKTAIIKNKVLGSAIDNEKVSTFKTTIDNFLNQWTGYANEARDILPTLKDVSTTNEFTVIDYNFIRDFIFGNYDYNSIKDFADGIVLGINDNKMKKAKDVSNFFSHTVSIAFDTEAEMVAELVESRSDKTMSMYTSKATAYDIKMFNNSRTYHMFGKDDRIVLYKAAIGIIDSLTKTNQPKELYNAMTKFGNDYDASKMWISIINNIVDYAIYSAVAYATRIYVLTKYIRCFERNVITEATDQHENILGIDPFDVMQNINPEPFSNIWGSMDTIFIKDPNNVKKFFGKYGDFLALLGVTSDNIPDDRNLYVSEKFLNNNRLYDKVKNNDLVDLIHDVYLSVDDSFMNPGSFEEFNHNLRCVMTNPLQGLAGTSNSKNELLHFIRKNDYYGDKFTIATYKKMSEELYHVSMLIIGDTLKTMDNLRYMANVVSSSDDVNVRIPTRNNSTNLYRNKKQLDESIMLLLGFYDEFIFAVSQKLTYMEASINNLYAIHRIDLSTKFTLTDPFTLFNDETLFSTTMVSVPETLRIPIESEDLFTLTSFEEACLQDELLRLTPGFENSLYLSEAGSSNVMNMILSLIKGLINSASAFFLNNFKPASDWVIKNKGDLLKINFSKDDKAIVYQYKLNITNGDTINGIQPFKIVDILKNVNKDEVMKDVEKWIKSLYPSDDIYTWFTDKQYEKTASIKYRNKIIFNTDSDKPVGTIELSGNSLKEEFAIWLNDMEHAGVIGKMLIDAGNAITTEINNLKSKAIVEYAILESDNNKEPDIKTDSTDPNALKPDPNAPKPDPNAPKPAEQSIQINGASTTSIPLVRINDVISKTWRPLYTSLQQVFTDEYKNIKDIHHQTFNSTNNTNDQNQK